MRGEALAPPASHIVRLSDESSLSSTGERPAVRSRTAPKGATLKIPAISLHNGSAKSAKNPFQVIGKPLPAIDAAKLATGRAAFAADVQPAGMLYACLLTSPHAHALIRHIDVSAAKALPGVHAVLTFKDVARTPFSSVERPLLATDLKDQYCLDYLVRYVGDSVAVVAAETLDLAEQALSLIEVRYDVLPAVFDPRQALDADAPSIHPESESQGIFDASRNVAARVHLETGDVEGAFSQSDLVVEAEYFLPLTQPAPLETHTVVTYFDEDDYLVVRSSTQAPHHVRRTLARVLDLPARRIRVLQPQVGGGFGVKQEVMLEHLSALLTIATNRPVMLTCSRSDEFRSSHVRQQHILRVKTGVKRDGTLLANQMILLASTGAYGTHPLIGRAVTSALPLYPCPNLRFIAEVLYTNQQPSGAFQGYSASPEFFALECHMDEIARQLQMDPLALRRKNWITIGDVYPLLKTTGTPVAPLLESCGLSECLHLVEEQLHWQEKREKSGRLRRGVGVALGLHGLPATGAPIASDASGAIIKLNEDGSFDIFANASDGGSGSATLLAQTASETLGVPLDDILLHTSDTSSAPFDTATSPFSTLYGSGGAIKKAAEQMRRQLLIIAGRLLSALPEALKISAGTITAPSGQTVTIPQLAAYALHIESRHIMTTASWKPQVSTTFAAQGVEVEVDIESGHVRVLKAIVALDAGKVINPQIAEGQILGSLAQGLGAAISEEILYDHQQGHLLTSTFTDYGLFTAADMPELQIYLVETSDPSGPFGAKAITDLPLSGIAPAIANAVADALGICPHQLPLTPERILRALHAHTQAQAQAQAAAKT
jgi:putative selenate reductase molybdopterin-binding subunit